MHELDNTSLEAHNPVSSRRSPGHWPRRVVLPCALALALLLVALGWYEADKHWPFRYRNAEPMLQALFASQIKIDHYRRVYFPHPGFVAQGITLRRNSAPNLPPLASAKELRVEGGWLDLLTLQKRVLLVEVTGMRVVIPAVGTPANHQDFPPGSSGDFTGPKTTVDLLHLIDARLQLTRDQGAPLIFPIRDLTLRHVHQGDPVAYDVDMGNAKPGGRILATGSFGPIRANELGATALSGRFSFAPVHLARIGNLRGTLWAHGEFSGNLASIEAFGTSTTPDFAVGSGQPLKVDGTAQATVNGLNGDVVLHRVELKTRSTVVNAAGWVRGSPKVTELDLRVTRGRAEDLLWPFLKHQPPVAGVVWLKSHAHVDPAVGGAKFLDRLRMDGEFEIPRETLTQRHTEKALSAFSERAQGGTETTAQAPPDVVSSLRGNATMQNGVLHTRALRFSVPGADANLHGRYDLRNGAAHLDGTITMQADISHVTTGWKSVLLKPLAPFFRKKPAGAVVPIAVTGTPGKYKVGQNLLGTK